MSRPLLPDRGGAGLTFFPVSPGSIVEAVSPIGSTGFCDSLQAHRERFPAPVPAPPVLVRNPFLPAAK